MSFQSKQDEGACAVCLSTLFFYLFFYTILLMGKKYVPRKDAFLW